MREFNFWLRDLVFLCTEQNNSNWLIGLCLEISNFVVRCWDFPMNWWNVVNDSQLYFTEIKDWTHYSDSSNNNQLYLSKGLFSRMWFSQVISLICPLFLFLTIKGIPSIVLKKEAVDVYEICLPKYLLGYFKIENSPSIDSFWPVVSPHEGIHRFWLA